MRGSFTVEELGRLTDSEISGEGSHLISGVESLDSAQDFHASFLENPRYVNQLKETKAGVIFVPHEVASLPQKNFLKNKQPSLAFQKVIELFLESAPSGFSSIHPTAVIHPEAQISEGVTIGPYVVIDRGAVIGSRSVIGATVFIGAEACLGEECFVYPQVVIHERSLIGNRVHLQSGCVIGSSGFGFITDHNGKHHPLKQLGIVVIEDDVEIGSNTTIDRARFKETRIRRGTKIDNLVQIAHQVDVGEDNLIVAQVGIAGSTQTGKNVVLAGQVGVVGHIKIADRAILAARSAPIKSITEGGVYSGAPAIPIKEFNEQQVYLRNLKKLVKRVEALEKK